MQHLFRQLNDVLKYGRAPEDMIRMGTKAAKQGTYSTHPNNVHDLKLQDFLQEHDDPREAIVRGHLEGRGEVDHLSELLGEDVLHPDNVEIHRTPDGELHFSDYSNRKGDRKAVAVDWFVMEPEEIGASKPTTIHRHYYANMTPEEADHIKANLPDLKKL